MTRESADAGFVTMSAAVKAPGRGIVSTVLKVGMPLSGHAPALFWPEKGTEPWPPVARGAASGVTFSGAPVRASGWAVGGCPAETSVLITEILYAGPARFQGHCTPPFVSCLPVSGWDRFQSVTLGGEFFRKSELFRLPRPSFISKTDRK